MVSSSSLYPQFRFDITHRQGGTRARLGRLTTPHGTLETPAFIFCATKATLKGMTAHQITDAGTQIILSNTYHLMLQPGADRVAHMGGLHKMMGWQGPMLTDSGGFQIFSLGHGSVADEIKGRKTHGRPSQLRTITEEGATFKSYINGDVLLLTPEESIAVQQKLGADLIVVLDECTPFHVPKDYTESSTRRSHRWAVRCLQAFSRTSHETQALYGIVQGGVYPDLRQESASFVADQPFFGQAVGGSLGSSKSQMHDVIEMTLPFLAEDRPIHLLGIGGMGDIWHGVRQGIDTFDCVHPTRIARHGGALVLPETGPLGAPMKDDLSLGNRDHLNLMNTRFKEDLNPIEADCPCETCQTSSRAYLHHLFKAGEMLGPIAVTLHNVMVMNRFMERIRRWIGKEL